MRFWAGLAALAVVGGICTALVGEDAKTRGKSEEKKDGSLLSKIRRNHQVDSSADRLNNSFLLVRSPDGRGSAFMTRLWDQPVIVTNAHVYLEMKEPEVVDINGKVYKIKEVLGSKSRDLVILSYEDPDPDAEMLSAAGDVGAIPLSKKVIAYGNSLGDDVIVTQTGKLLGIGPDKIETDAPFVGGNSGGPVLLQDGGEVIGVATYLRHIAPDSTTVGSRYDASRVRKVVRRFATRIDNLQPDDLEPLKLNVLDREREVVRRSNDWVSHIQNVFQKELTLDEFREFSSDCFKRGRVLIDGETVEWHSSYLKNKFETNREMIVAVLKSFELDSVVELSRLGAILDRNAEKMSVARRTGYPVRCFFCMGSGKYSKKIVNPQYRPNSAYARYIMKYEACAVCDGNGKRPLWPERLCFTVPPDVKEEMGKRITAAGEEFCGFHLGGEKKEELDRHIFYRKEPLYVVPNSFGETMFFAGNHQDRAAVCTVLTFMFDRLLGVAVLVPQTAGGLEEGLERYHHGKISGASPISIRAARVEDRKALPLDRRGRPLLKPIRPVNIQDEPAYRGMLIMGYHNSLTALTSLDLPVLARRCKGHENL